MLNIIYKVIFYFNKIEYKLYTVNVKLKKQQRKTVILCKKKIK
jgi:hypothetical protein